MLNQGVLQMAQKIHKPLIWLFSLVAIAMIAYALNRGVYVGSDVSPTYTVTPPLLPIDHNPWLLSGAQAEAEAARVAAEEAANAANPMDQAYKDFSTVAKRVQDTIAAGQKPSVDDEAALQRGFATFGNTYYHKNCRYLFPSGIFSERTGGWNTAKEAEANSFCTLFLR
jgi:hypothetical protein